MEFADGQCESCRVLNIFLRDLLRLVDGELHSFARIPDLAALRILYLADDIERGFVAVASLDEGNLRSGNDQRYWNIEAIFVETEIECLQIYSDICCR